jgi:membrane protease YdiL (CAAX protease family)
MRNIGKHLVIGILLGAALQSLTIAVMYLKGGYTVVSINPLVFMISGFIMAFASAVFEELLIRGILFRLIEEKLGSYIALAISAVIFGVLHLLNPNSSLIAALGIALQAGVLLGVSYIYTRNLWFPIAVHFAWNFTQGAIFGAAVSGGILDQSLINPKIEGAEWFTGGLFGPEGSVQATVFCLIAAVVLLVLCQKQGKLTKPYWKK